MKQISLSVIANIKMPKGVGATLNRLDISVMDKYTIKKKNYIVRLKKINSGYQQQEKNEK